MPLRTILMISFSPTLPPLPVCTRKKKNIPNYYCSATWGKGRRGMLPKLDLKFQVAPSHNTPVALDPHRHCGRTKTQCGEEEAKSNENLYSDIENEAPDASSELSLLLLFSFAETSSWIPKGMPSRVVTRCTRGAWPIHLSIYKVTTSTIFTRGSSLKISSENSTLQVFD